MEKKKIPPHLHTEGQLFGNCLICQGKEDVVKARDERIQNFVPRFEKGRHPRCPECGKINWGFDRNWRFKKTHAICKECGFFVDL